MQTIEERGLLFYSLSYLPDLIPKAYKKQKPGKDIARKVEQEYAKYGVNSLNLG